MMKKRTWYVVVLVVLALVLAGCGGDDDGDDTAPAATEAAAAEATESTGGLSLNPAPDLGGAPDLAGGLAGGVGDERQLPGCSDPDSDECPAPLEMPLDGEASFENVRINYPSRYFNAAVGDEAAGDALIEITPSENNRFEERAAFQVYFAESAEAAVADLVDPHTAEWNAGALDGIIAVTLDDEQQPQHNTTIGAFDLPDGRAIVLKLETTGKYGWDLFSRVYDAMLQTLVVDESES